MFGPLGFAEITFILVLALLIFGPRKLPELARALGKSLGEFRRATSDLKRSFNAEMSLEDDEKRPNVARRPTLDEPSTGGAESSEPASSEQPASSEEPGSSERPVPRIEAPRDGEPVARGSSSTTPDETAPSESAPSGESAEAVAPQDEPPSDDPPRND